MFKKFKKYLIIIIIAIILILSIVFGIKFLTNGEVDLLPFIWGLLGL